MLRFRYRGNQASSVVLRYLYEVWQFRVEIEHYSVEYFDYITAMEADRPCSFPGTLTVVGFSPTRHPYSLIHVVSSNDPRR